MVIFHGSIVSFFFFSADHRVGHATKHTHHCDPMVSHLLLARAAERQRRIVVDAQKLLQGRLLAYWDWNDLAGGRTWSKHMEKGGKKMENTGSKLMRNIKNSNIAMKSII